MGKNLDRALKMVQLFQGGMTLQAIGTAYGLSRERVRQILKRQGISGADGGISVTPKSFYGLARAEYDHYVKAYPGCREAFRSQRGAAKHRGIEWKLTFREWINEWEGFWDRRGRGHGLVMCRKKDQGAYEVGNVFIAPGSFNNSAYAIRKYYGIDIDAEPYYASKLQ